MWSAVDVSDELISTSNDKVEDEDRELISEQITSTYEE